MINQYPLWKNLAIALVLFVGIIYALPNIYGEDPALQITSARAGKLDASLAGTVTATLEDAGIAFDPERGHLFVTGKYWPYIYEIEVISPDLAGQTAGR